MIQVDRALAQGLSVITILPIQLKLDGIGQHMSVITDKQTRQSPSSVGKRIQTPGDQRKPDKLESYVLKLKARGLVARH